MKQLYTEILIDASVQEVWNKVIDFASYEKWNPFIRKIDGEIKVGEKLKVELTIDAKIQCFEPLVQHVTLGKRLTWRGKLWFNGLFDGEHSFCLEQMPDGSTKFIHYENFSGILVRGILLLIGKQTLSSFEKMNLALKDICESETVVK